jgi:hypothetical protein
MRTGFRGTFVISWLQTETDGLKAAPLHILTVGASWRWTGRCVRVDGAQDVLHLHGAEGAAELKKRAARMAQRLIGAAVPHVASRQNAADETVGQDDPAHGFVVTDGSRSYSATVIHVRDTAARLVMFVDEIPPANTELWVVRRAHDLIPPVAPAGGGVICFTPNTSIRTANGSKLIQDLRIGDTIATKDNGLQAIRWIGHRCVTAGRLHAMPHLRPIRFQAGAFGIGRPEKDLLVSPQHRMLVKGAAAVALFNTPEVLVAAEDLLNGTSVHVDLTPRDAVYIHLMLDQHQVIWANGLETESFHPANTALHRIEPTQHQALLQLLPDLAADPFTYGDYARRNLSAPEAAILQYDSAA